MAEKPKPRLNYEDLPIVPPPATALVDFERKPVIYTATGTPLVRKIGF